jgi:hypothetical protein
MKIQQRFFVLGLTLILIGFGAQAREKKKNTTFGKIKEIETLFFISQDLDENTAVYINFKESCYCSCRDTLWSCTDLNCKMNMRECENEEPVQEALDQSRITPPTYSSYIVEETPQSTAPAAYESSPATPAVPAYANTKINPATTSKTSDKPVADNAPALVRYQPRTSEW